MSKIVTQCLLIFSTVILVACTSAAAKTPEVSDALSVEDVEKVAKEAASPRFDELHDQRFEPMPYCFGKPLDRVPLDLDFSRRPRRPVPDCLYSVEITASADDAWAVFLDGQQLTPANNSSERDWRQPARYEAVVQGGSNLVIGIHAWDVQRIYAGFLGHVRVSRLNPPTTLSPMTQATGVHWHAFKPSPNQQTPPADWNRTPYLPFSAATAKDWEPASLASDCINAWGGNAQMLKNWTQASSGASPTDWIWQGPCDAQDPGFRQENWYRMEIPLDTCPMETPPPPPSGKCCSWKLSSHGFMQGLFDKPLKANCTTNFDLTPPAATCFDRIGCAWNKEVCKYRCMFDYWSWTCE